MRKILITLSARFRLRLGILMANSCHCILPLRNRARIPIYESSDVMRIQVSQANPFGIAKYYHTFR